ncbi:hypothetical protein JCM8097_007278 [Rhodosporidiobolus ruineniae]
MPSSSSPTTPCFVCGLPTTQHCSRCSSWSFRVAFCSKEHQRLVWPVHRLVCGRFDDEEINFPPLSRREVADALSLLGDGGDVGNALCDLLTEVEIPIEFRESFLSSLSVERDGDVYGVPVQVALALVRTLLAQHRPTDYPKASPLDDVSDVFIVLSNQFVSHLGLPALGRFWSSLPSSPAYPSGYPVYIPFLFHLYLAWLGVLFAATDAIKSSRPDARVLKDFAEGAGQRYDNVVNGFLTEVDPEVASWWPRAGDVKPES